MSRRFFYVSVRDLMKPMFGPRRLLVAALLSLALPAVADGEDGVATDPAAALHEGNRLYRNGQIEAAIEAYERGWSPDEPHPTLVYNLGTAYHHLDRLPEAILWYRRAAASDDPWLEENLWLARRSLGSQVLPATGAAGWLARHRGGLRTAGIALVWIALVAFLVAPRLPRWIVVAVALAAAGLYATAWAAGRWGPRPAVVLEDCRSAAGEVPAGTEAWVVPSQEGWKISGAGGATCPGDAVALVFPD